MKLIYLRIADSSKFQPFACFGSKMPAQGMIGWNVKDETCFGESKV